MLAGMWDGGRVLGWIGLISTTARTPGMPMATWLSKDLIVPPVTGLIATAATFMLGSLKSIPKTVVPVTLPSASSRFIGLPTNLQSFGSLIFSLATGSGGAFAASAAT